MTDLTDEELSWAEQLGSKQRGIGLMRRMAAEIRRRRAEDITDADREALRFLLTTYGKVPEDRGEREVYDSHVHAARLLCERLLGGDRG
jgi:hypothetical protein